MIRFKTITVSNFWSFGKKPTMINLDKKQTTLIIGDNRDVGERGNSRNGVGKSAIYQAVLYALFGKGAEPIKQDEFINLTNAKKLSVTLDYEVNGVEYQVVRTRKPNNLEFYINGETHTRDSAANTEEEIQRSIGMNHSIFINTMYMSPDVTPFLGMKPAEQRNFVEEVLSLNTLSERAETLKSLRKDCESELQVEQGLLRKDQENNDNLNKQINQLHDKKALWKDENQKKINNLKEEYEELKSIDLDEVQKTKQEYDQFVEEKQKTKQDMDNVQKQLDQCDEEIQRYQKEMKRIQQHIDQKNQWIKETESKMNTFLETLETFKGIDLIHYVGLNDRYDELVGEIKIKENEESDSSDAIQSLKKDINKKQKELDQLNSGECPYCHQKYHSEDQIEAVDQEVKRLTQQQQEMEKTHQDIEEQLKKLKDDKKEVQDQIGEYTREYLNYVRKEYEKAQQEIERLSNETNPYDQVIQDDLKEYDIELDSFEDFFNDRIQAYEDKKNVLQSQFNDLDLILDQKNNKVNELADYVLTDSEINEVTNRFKEVEKELDRLNNETNPYDEQIKLMEDQIKPVDNSKLKDLENRVEHYKLLIKMLTDNKSFIRKNVVDQYIPFINSKINYYLDILNAPHFVEIKNDMSVEILYMNKEVSYGLTSKGERLRLNLATCLAFRDIVSMMGKSSNLLLVDEFLDVGGDHAFFNHSLSLLKGYADSVFLISHREEVKEIVDDVMTIVKENGFSRVE